jgi:hypothetical protein
MSNLSASIAELKTLVGQTDDELQSLVAGKKASAPRVRASLQKIKTLCHSMRQEVMNHTKALPVKKRAKTADPVADELPPPAEPEELEELPPSPPKLVRQKRVRKKTIKAKVV